LKKIFFLTGRPGIGKTTVLLRIVEKLKKEGLKVDGLISREVREDGARVGFKIIFQSHSVRSLFMETVSSVSLKPFLFIFWEGSASH